MWSPSSRHRQVHKRRPGGRQRALRADRLHKQGQSVTLKANDRFWRGRPKVDKLQFVHYDNTDAAVQALIKGDIDLVRDTTPAQFASLKSNPAITLNEGRNRRYTELLLNWSNPDGTTGKPLGDGNKALRDVRVRQALPTPST